jgi:hypothetical protein
MKFRFFRELMDHQNKKSIARYLREVGSSLGAFQKAKFHSHHLAGFKINAPPLPIAGRVLRPLAGADNASEAL